MNIVLDPKQFNKKNLYFSEPIENTIMEESIFIKIIYSNELMTLNGVFVDMEMKITNKDSYFKKIKYIFDTKQNSEILQKIYNIETDILDKYNSKKIKKRTIYDSLSSGNMKIFPNIDSDINNCGNKFILKVSGLWESKNEIGVTYKIVIQ